MNVTHLTALAATIATASFFAASEANAQDFRQITTEREFRAIVVDRKVYSDAGWTMVQSNGKASGRIFGKKFSANWVWDNKMYCRNAVLGAQKLGTDCQVVKVSGNQVQFIREYGKGGVGQGTME
jgi:hypothetical protein